MGDTLDGGSDSLSRATCSAGSAHRTRSAAPARGRTLGTRSRSGFLPERSPMSDKSPRQNMSKKSGKSIKEKRAEKRSKGSEETFSDKIHPPKKK